MKLKKLLETLSEFKPVLFCGNPEFEVERLADDWLSFFEPESLYVEDLDFDSPALQNCGTVIVSEHAVYDLSGLSINVIIVSVADLEKIKRIVEDLFD